MYKIEYDKLTPIEKNVLDVLKTKKPGQIFSIVYKTIDSRKALRNFHKLSRYTAQYVVSEQRKEAKEYRQTHAINNFSIMNDEVTDVPCVVHNPKSGLKLRVPLMKESDSAHYFVDDIECTRDEYYAKMKSLGYAIPKANPPTYGVLIRNFTLRNIYEIK